MSEIKATPARLVPPIYLWLPVLVMIALIGVLLNTDVSRHRGVDIVTSIVLGIVIFVTLLSWFTFRSGYPKEVRWSVFAALAVGFVAFCAVFELDQFTGDMIPTFRLRSLRPDRLLARPSRVAATADLATTTKDDFAQFLGPGRNLVLDNVALENWTSVPPRLLWQQDIGAAWSGFAVVNSCAVTMEQRGDAEMITCYDISTGKLLWAYEHPARYETVLGGIGPRATPTIHEGKVYALGGTGLLVCLDGANGKLLWKRDLLKEFNKPASEEISDLPFGRASSPLIVKDLVVVHAGGPSGKRVSLAAFNKATGKPVWQAGTRNIGYSSPVLATVAGREQILDVTEGHVLGHDPETGKVLWEFEWEGHSSTDATNSNAVAVGPDRVFVSRGYGGGAALFQLIPKGDGTFTTKTIYHNRGVLRTKFTNVAMKDGYAYGLSDGVLECVKVADGKRAWKSGRYGHGQILLVGSNLIVLTESGDLLLVQAKPELDAETNVLGEIHALEGTTWNNMALYGDLLLIRNAQQAACYRLQTAAMP